MNDFRTSANPDTEKDARTVRTVTMRCFGEVWMCVSTGESFPQGCAVETATWVQLTPVEAREIAAGLLGAADAAERGGG